jgi:hypothetical protein
MVSRLEMWTSYPHCAQKRDLLINYSEVESFITLGRSALAPDEFVRLSKRYALSREQREVVDKVRLQGWNALAKERAG